MTAALAFGVCACDSGYVPEINLAAPIGRSPDETVKAASAFASAFADYAHLRIAGQVLPIKGSDLNSTLIVSLVPQGARGVSVSVIVFKSENRIIVRINGEVESVLAKSLAEQARELLTKTFPGVELQSFTRKRGIFGP